MTTPIASIDNTTLLNLTPNLDIGDIADPALRLAYFQYLNVYIQTITTAFNAFVANGSVGTGNLADLSVTSAKLADLAVLTGKIADLAIVTSKINDLAVTAAKIASGTITSLQIADLGIATGDLADALITTIKIADANVTTAKLIDACVTLSKMAANSVGTTQLVDLSVTTAKIAIGAVGVSQLSPAAAVNETVNNALIVALKADVLQRSVNVKSVPYSAVGNGVTDDTSAIQTALNYLESIGGGVLYVPAGTYIISIARSTSLYSCIVIPSNVTIQGAGMGVTTFTRPSSERSTDGLLFANKAWDTATGYDGAGNIKFFDFTITDGAATPNRGSGDLIALGHAHDILIQRVESLNHDQHFVDMAGSRYITIRDCVSTNNVDASGSPPFQIDQAIAGAIRGINGDGTSTTDVTIENCQIKKCLADMLIHFHNGCIAQNIVIQGNTLNGNYLVGSKNIIYKDATTSLINCKINNNTFIANNGSVRMMNMLANEDTVISNLEICDNTFSGVSRIGIYVGVATVTSAFPDFNEINIHDNIFNLDWRTASGTVQAIKTAFCKNVKVYDNDINYYVAATTSTNVYPIWIQDNKYAEVYNNTVRALDTNANSSLPYIGILVDMTLTITKSLFGTHKIRNNQVNGVGFLYGISQLCDTTTPATYTTGIISGNYVYDSAPIKAHYFESLQGSCDGTNNVAFVDFGASGVVGNTKILAIASSQFTQNIPLPFKKSRITVASPNGNLNPGTFKWEKFFSQVLIGNFAGDMEEIQNCYLSSTTFAGTQIVDIVVDETTTPATNKFSILTGVTGITVVLNNSTFQPVVRTAGYLMIRVGL